MKKPSAKEAYTMLAMGGFINQEQIKLTDLQEDLDEKARLEEEAKKQKNQALLAAGLQMAGSVASVIPGGQIIGAGLTAASSLAPLAFKDGGVIEEETNDISRYEVELAPLFDAVDYKNGGYHIKDKASFNRVASGMGLSEKGLQDFIIKNSDQFYKKLVSGGKITKSGGLEAAHATTSPNGLTEFQGNTHVEGGIKINDNSEVEGGETKWNDFVFTNAHQLTEKAALLSGVPKNYVGKTFAEISKKFGENIKERPNDPIELKTFNLLMERLQKAHLIDVPQSRPQAQPVQAQEGEALMRNGGKMYRNGGADEEIITEEPGAFLRANKPVNPFVSAIPDMIATTQELIENPSAKPSNYEAVKNYEPVERTSEDSEKPATTLFKPLRDNAMQYAPVATSVAEMIMTAKNTPQFLDKSDYKVQPDVKIKDIDRNLLQRQVDEQIASASYRASQVSSNPSDFANIIQAISTGAVKGYTEAELNAQNIERQNSITEQQMNKGIEQFNSQVALNVDNTNISEKDAYVGQLMDSLAALGMNTGALGREIWTKDQINTMLPYNTRGEYANAAMAPQSQRDLPQNGQILQALLNLIQTNSQINPSGR